MVIFVHLRESSVADAVGVVWGSRALRDTGRVVLMLACLLVTNILVLVFQACSRESLAYLQQESTGSGSTRFSVLQLCSPVIASGSTSHPRAHFSPGAKLFSRRQHFVSPQNLIWSQQFVSDHPVNSSQVEFKHVVYSASASVLWT